MNDSFVLRVRAAAVAGWWTVLVAVGFIIILWLAYLCVTTTHPAWMLHLWGPEMTWPVVQYMFLWVILIFRIIVWLLVLLVIWLTLWARQLCKQAMNA